MWSIILLNVVQNTFSSGLPNYVLKLGFLISLQIFDHGTTSLVCIFSQIISTVESIGDFRFVWSNLKQIGILGIYIANKARLFVFNNESKLSTAILYSYKSILSYSGQYQEIILTISYAETRKMLPSLTEIFFPDSNSLNIYENLGIIGLRGLFQKISEVLLTSQNLSTGYIHVENADVFNEFKNSLTKTTHKMFQLSIPKIVAKRVLSILKNVLGPSVKLTISSTEIMPSLSLTKFLGYEFDSVEFSLQYSPHEIQFIGCGHTFADRRSYLVLLASFDSYCWICILLILFVFTPAAWLFIFKHSSATSGTYQFINLAKVLLSIFKSLTEQSTPFHDTTFHKNNLKKKLIVSCLLLSVLVLSNAYKNDSINVLISPFRFRPFTSFDQLTQNDYTVFVESSDLNFRNANLNRQGDLLFIFLSTVRENNHSVYTPEVRYQDIHKFFMLRIDSVLQSLLRIFSQKKIKIPDHVENYFNRSFMNTVNIIPNILAYPRDEYIPSNNVTNAYVNLQKEKSLELLQKCNRTAILTHNPIVREYESRLKLQGGRKISIGTDKMLASRIGIKPLGWFPLFVLHRLRGMDHSGIVDWWNKLVTSHLVSVRTQNYVHKNQNITSKGKKNLVMVNKGGMCGNLFVIFMVYLNGYFIGLTVFFLEVGILTTAKKFFTKSFAKLYTIFT